MTKIKLCGLTREADIIAANKLLPEYTGFVFAKKSKRYISPEKAAVLKALLDKRITAVGVFVNEPHENTAQLLSRGVIDIAQLHGNEDEEYIKRLRALTDKPLIKAFSVTDKQSIETALKSSADYILLDSGTGGTGTTFDHTLLKGVDRSYFLAGGLDICNIREVLKAASPYAVDVSSGIETNGIKDEIKMAEFTAAVRKENVQ